MQIFLQITFERPNPKTRLPFSLPSCDTSSSWTPICSDPGLAHCRAICLINLSWFERQLVGVEVFRADLHYVNCMRNLNNHLQFKCRATLSRCEPKASTINRRRGRRFAFYWKYAKCCVPYAHFLF